MKPARERPPAEPVRFWRAGSREIPMDRPIVVGILNVTPDSFSDGGNFFLAGDAAAQAERLIEDGADILDIGGESTRPGATRVDEPEEIRRTRPVVAAVRKRWPDLPISIDTTRSVVAAAAIDAGADIVNDVSAMRLDSRMARLAASTGCGVVLMHSRGSVEEMATYEHAVYSENPVAEIVAELAERARAVTDAGVAGSSIVLDPGIGFSKMTAHSVGVIREIERLVDSGYPVMVGASRKRFVSESMSGESRARLTMEDRDIGTVAANVIALHGGAMLFRVHNVRANRCALDVAWAVLRAGS